MSVKWDAKSSGWDDKDNNISTNNSTSSFANQGFNQSAGNTGTGGGGDSGANNVNNNLYGISSGPKAGGWAATNTPKNTAAQSNNGGNNNTNTGGGGSSSWKPKIKTWVQSGELNKMVALSNLPFFGQQSFMGKTFVELFKRSKAHFSDIIDRVNCYWVPALLFFFVTVISANVFGVFGTEPMRCLKSAELEGDEREFALDYCQSKNTYYVAPEEGIPWSNTERRQRQLGYYHWVPIMMFLQALLFMLPNWLWNALNQQSGIEFLKFLEESTRLKHLDWTQQERPTLVRALSEHIGEAILNRESYMRRRRVTGCRMGQSLGIYVTLLYVAIKALYLINVAGQFMALNSFIGSGYSLWGLEVLQALLAGENWQDSPIFPRLTLCDVPIRRLGDTPRYTLQCHLRINTYNEKIYLCIWWGFLVLSVLTFVNFCYYFFTMILWPWTQRTSVRHYLKQERFEDLVYSSKDRDRKFIDRFAEEALCKDGVLLFWFIESHAGPTVARELMGELFELYRNKMHQDIDDDGPSGVVTVGNRGGMNGGSDNEEEEDGDQQWAEGVQRRYGWKPDNQIGGNSGSPNGNGGASSNDPSAPKMSNEEESASTASSQPEEQLGNNTPTESSRLYPSNKLRKHQRRGPSPIVQTRRGRNWNYGVDVDDDEPPTVRAPPGFFTRFFRILFGIGDGRGGYTNNYHRNFHGQQPHFTMANHYSRAPTAKLPVKEV